MKDSQAFHISVRHQTSNDHMLSSNWPPAHLLSASAHLAVMSSRKGLMSWPALPCHPTPPRLMAGRSLLPLCRNPEYRYIISHAFAGAERSCAVQGYPILNLFLLANLMTTTSTLPVLLGLLDGPIASRLFTPLSALFGCWFSFAAIVVYGRIMLANWGGTMSDVSHLSLATPCSSLL